MSSPEAPKPEAFKSFLEKAKERWQPILPANAKAEILQIAGKQAERGKLTPNDFAECLLDARARTFTAAGRFR